MKLRDYQQECRDRAIELLSNTQSGLIVLATGLGKTVVAAHIADAFKNYGRILLLAHREELLFQGRDTLERITGLPSELEMAGDWATRSRSNLFGEGSGIVVSTIQTQIAGRREARMTRFDPNEFAFLIVDECHHATAKSYRAVIDYYRQNPNIKILGLTATPDRADEAALGQIFDDVVYEYDISQGIEGGWLVPIVQQLIYVDGLDFSEVRTTAGDLNAKQLGRILEYEQNLHEMTTPILDLTDDEKTLIFTVTVAQSERMAEILNRYKKGSAAHVDGKTPKDVRRAIFEAYARGEIQYLVNVGVTTEGFDQPDIRHIVMARPTKSRSLFAQMLGRGTRPLSNLVDGIESAAERRAAIAASAKCALNVIDFSGNAGRHKLIHPADILGGKYNDKIVELATKNIEKARGPINVTSELVKAEREWEKRRRDAEEAKLRQKVKGKSRYRTVSVDPFAVLDLVPYREPGYITGKAPTVKQIEVLNKFGIEVSENMTRTHATQLISAVFNRREKKLCTFRQANLLRRYGYDTEEITFDRASELITALKANGWKRPKEMLV